MIISRHGLGSFRPSKFDKTAFVANEYIPLYALQNSEDLESFNFYSKPSFTEVLRKGNTLKNIKDAFHYGFSTREIPINNRKFYIAKGVFFSENKEPLMVLSMKKEAYLDPTRAHFSEVLAGQSFSYNNYVLFYSTSFFIDPGLTPLNRRLQKEILQSCYEKGIEVRVIPSSEIEKNTFARLFEVKKTKSLTQLEAYMNQVLPNFLHNEGEDTFVEQEFEPIVIHREELSLEEEAMLFDTDTVSDSYIEPIREISASESQELADLAAEAAMFDDQSESLDQNNDDEEDWTDEDFEDEDEEEDAHTFSELTPTSGTLYISSADYLSSNFITVTNDTTSISIVDRLAPLQETYNMQMLRAQQAQSELERNVGWQSVIELVDDTE